jgi:hypothetical protein
MKEARKINFFIAHLSLASSFEDYVEINFTMNLLKSTFYDHIRILIAG